jgi:preprotein translocase subunit SecD
VFLVMLIAIGNRPLRGFAKALIVVGIVVNLFGAVTFDRYWQFYRGGNNAYDVVVAH